MKRLVTFPCSIMETVTFEKQNRVNTLNWSWKPARLADKDNFLKAR